MIRYHRSIISSYTTTYSNSLFIKLFSSAKYHSILNNNNYFQLQHQFSFLYPPYSSYKDRLTTYQYNFLSKLPYTHRKYSVQSSPTKDSLLRTGRRLFAFHRFFPYYLWNLEAELSYHHSVQM
jgi:hypothetical protein